MLALTVESAKMMAIAIAIGLIVLAYLVFKFIKEVSTKAILLLVIGGSILGIWNQRTDLSDCGKRVVQKAAQGDLSTTTCNFFGFDAKVSIPGQRGD